MSKITLIAAIGENLELGLGNDLIWYIPEDLKFFKDNTIGKPIVMGMNTLKSLPRLLPKREHIVLTRQNIELDSAIKVVHNIEEALAYMEDLDREIMVIGGAQIYSQFIDYADSMLLTEINDSIDADVYFPEFSLTDWERCILSNHKFRLCLLRHKHIHRG